MGPGRCARGAGNWTFKPVMKKGRFAGYVAVILVTTLLQQTGFATAFLANAAPQPFASGLPASSPTHPPTVSASELLQTVGSCMKFSITLWVVSDVEILVFVGYGFPGFSTMRHRSILRDEVAARLKELGNVSACSCLLLLPSIVYFPPEI